FLSGLWFSLDALCFWKSSQKLHHSRFRFSGLTKNPESGDGSTLARILNPGNQSFSPSVASAPRKANPSKGGIFAGVSPCQVAPHGLPELRGHSDLVFAPCLALSLVGP